MVLPNTKTFLFLSTCCWFAIASPVPTQEDGEIVISNRDEFLHFFETEIHWEIKESGPAGGLPLEPGSQYWYLTRYQGQEEDDGAISSEKKEYSFKFYIKKHICNLTKLEMSIKYCNFDTESSIWPVPRHNHNPDYHSLKTHNFLRWDYEQITLDDSHGTIELGGYLHMDSTLFIEEIILWHNGNYECLRTTTTDQIEISTTEYYPTTDPRNDSSTPDQVFTEVTTEDATSTELTTEDAKSTEVTTEDATSTEATTEDATSTEVTTEDATSTEVTTEDATSTEVTTEDATSTEVTTEDAKSTEVTTEDATSTEATTEDATSTEVTTEDATSTEVTTEDATSTEVTTEDATSIEVTTEDATSTEVTTEDATSTEITTEDATSEATTEDATSTEVTTEDATSTEVITEDATSTEVITEDATSTEVTTEDATATEVATEDAISTEVTTEDATSSDVTPKDATSTEVTTINDISTEPSTEETTIDDNPCHYYSNSVSTCLGSGCSYCAGDFYDSSKCDTYENLVVNGCSGICGVPPVNVIIDPNQPQNPIQNLTLCPNENKTFTVTFKLESHPVDIYVLLDLSRSMDDDRDNLMQLSSQLISAVQNMSNDFTLGYGGHVDKPWFNFGSRLAGDYSFKNHLSLTKSVEEFRSAVSVNPVLDGADLPESQLDAMFQIAECTSEIGWRFNSRHILLLLTDDAYHKAGDGRRFGLSVFNRRCALSPAGLYTGEVTYDYPSEQDIINVFNDKKITPIFGITELSTRHYENLQRNIPNSAIGVLNTDSSNVVELLVNEYKKIEQKTILERDGVDDGSLNIRYFSSCNGDTVEETKVCDSLAADGSVTFTISINLKDCPVARNPDDEKLVRIQPKGLSTAFQVAFKTICKEDWE